MGLALDAFSRRLQHPRFDREIFDRKSDGRLGLRDPDHQREPLVEAGQKGRDACGRTDGGKFMELS